MGYKRLANGKVVYIPDIPLSRTPFDSSSVAQSDVYENPQIVQGQHQWSFLSPEQRQADITGAIHYKSQHPGLLTRGLLAAGNYLEQNPLLGKLAFGGLWGAGQWLANKAASTSGDVRMSPQAEGFWSQAGAPAGVDARQNNGYYNRLTPEQQQQYNTGVGANRIGSGVWDAMLGFGMMASGLNRIGPRSTLGKRKPVENKIYTEPGAATGNMPKAERSMSNIERNALRTLYKTDQAAFNTARENSLVNLNKYIKKDLAEIKVNRNLILQKPFSVPLDITIPASSQFRPTEISYAPNAMQRVKEYKLKHKLKTAITPLGAIGDEYRLFGNGNMLFKKLSLARANNRNTNGYINLENEQGNMVQVVAPDLSFNSLSSIYPLQRDKRPDPKSPMKLGWENILYYSPQESGNGHYRNLPYIGVRPEGADLYFNKIKPFLMSGITKKFALDVNKILTKAHEARHGLHFTGLNRFKTETEYFSNQEKLSQPIAPMTGAGDGEYHTQPTEMLSFISPMHSLNKKQGYSGPYSKAFENLLFNHKNKKLSSVVQNQPLWHTLPAGLEEEEKNISNILKSTFGMLPFLSRIKKDSTIYD